MWYILSFPLLLAALILVRLICIPITAPITHFLFKNSNKVFFVEKANFLLSSIISATICLRLFDNYIFELITAKEIDDIFITKYYIILLSITILNAIIGYNDDKKNGPLMKGSGVFDYGIKNIHNYYFTLSFSTPIGIIFYIIVFKLLL